MTCLQNTSELYPNDINTKIFSIFPSVGVLSAFGVSLQPKIHNPLPSRYAWQLLSGFDIKPDTETLLATVTL